MPLVYKYLPPERSTFLDDGMLRMTQPGDLNDPFECLSFHVTFNLKPLAFAQVMQLSRERGGCPTPGQIAAILAEVEDPDYRRAFSDNCYRSFIKHLDEQYGVLSFSKQCVSSTMWAHYADKHQGFCIGFEQPVLALPDDNEQIQCGIYYNVLYADKRKTIKSTGGVQAEARFMYMKSGNDWKYEDEVRVSYRLATADVRLSDKSERGYPVLLKRFPFETVKELMVGYYANTELVNMAKDFARAHAVPLYRMTLNDSDEFALSRERLGDLAKTEYP